MSRRASEIAAQVTRMTSSVVQVPVPPVRHTPEAGALTGRKTTQARFTVIMPREQHHFIMQLALDLDADASTLTRTLFAMLKKDPGMAALLRQEVADRTTDRW
jgi:hypothetical protein